MARILVTPALPYINGIKHLGNLVGSMLPSDVHARYMRMRGHEVLHIGATDEHGTPAELAAAAEGVPVAEYCARMHDRQRALGERFRLGFDWFGRSSRPPTHWLTQHLADQLDKNGMIRQVETRQVYSPRDRRFLPDRFVEGVCPDCGYERARGDQCENCTRQLDPTDLINPRSAISGSTEIELRDTAHLFLLQSKMRDRLREWIESKTDWPKLSRSIALKWLNDGEGLQDRGITRDLDWGVPVRHVDGPWPGMEGKVFYVWFDAPIAYIGATMEWAEATGGDWKRWWREDAGAGDVRYVQFMAKDNIPFHTLSFPATLMGSGEPWKLVDYVKGFNWLTFDGGKFSTSQRRGVFMDDALEILPADCWRWWLLSHAPETGDSDFVWESLRDGVNKDLADILGNFIHRVTTFCVRRHDSRIPEGGVGGAAEAALASDLASGLPAYEHAMDAIEFRRATGSLRALWSAGNEYLQRAEPWAHIGTDPNRAAMAVRTALSLARTLAVLTAPFLPDTAERMLRTLDLPLSELAHWPASPDEALALLPPGHRIGTPRPLFAKIEDSQLEAWRARFGGGPGVDEAG